MNLKRFTGRTPRDALALVRQAFGDDAVVMSTKPCAEGVEVLAMAPESVQDLERVGANSPPSTFRNSAFGGLPAPVPPEKRGRAAAASAGRATSRVPGLFERVEPTLDGDFAATVPVEQDVRALQMSTLSFQDYVRDRMLRRREAEIAAAEPPSPPAPPVISPIAQARARLSAQQAEQAADRTAVRLSAQGLPPADPTFAVPGVARAAALAAAFSRPVQPRPGAKSDSMGADTTPLLHKVAPVARPEPPVLRDAVGSISQTSQTSQTPQMPQTPQALQAPQAPLRPPAPSTAAAAPQSASDARQDQAAMMTELRSMRGLIEQRFGALAFMEKLQRQPRQAQLTQRLLDAGFSPALTRRLAECLPPEVDEMAWAAGVLERNLPTGDRDAALEDAGGVYALIGATGVGKTTSTAKIAAAFATKHGAANLGLITLDAYRVAAHEQLRTYGRILGVPVHTAHDRASLEDLLELLVGKRMVLIDTAGMAQRDARTRELLEMLQRPSINRLVVVSASAQGETIEDQLSAYAAPGCRGVVLSKVDEAVKLAPALDAMIRSRLKVLAVANGQRVPEDWHRLSAHALVQRALRANGAPAWRMEAAEVNLVFAGQPLSGAGGAAAAAQSTTSLG